MQASYPNKNELEGKELRMPEKVVIIGSGPAGWTAAIYAARAALNPVVYQGAGGENLPLGQLALTTEVENFPSWPAGDTRQYLKTALKEEDQPYWVIANKPQPTHGINGPELVALCRQQAANFGTRIVSDDIVKVELDKHPFVLHSRRGERIETLTVIIATGANANYLGLPSEHHFKNNGVSACAVCDGALPRFRNKPIVVVGGGDSAVEEANYLTKYGSKVHMLLRRDVLRASKIMQQRAIENPKIEIHKFTELDEVLGTDHEGVTGVRVRNNKTNEKLDVPCSGVFLAIGHTPNTKFLNGQLKLNEKGYVQWTQLARTYTSIDGVFAAGDVADDYYRQAVSAAGTGCMAALDAERWLAHHGHL
jgi:thioredoxin reductase (NADPH)